MIGTSLSRHKIVEKLGAGGMGEVYRAEESNLSRQVAIKALPYVFSGDPERLARFEREARLLASRSHIHIASIYGLEQVDGRGNMGGSPISRRKSMDSRELTHQRNR